MNNTQIYERAMHKQYAKLSYRLETRGKRGVEQAVEEAEDEMHKIEGRGYDLDSWQFNMDLESFEDRKEIYERAVYRACQNFVEIYKKVTLEEVAKQ